jgi:hypothetical protein
LVDQILKGGVGFFVSGSLGVGDVARNVLQRERLCLKTSHCGGQSIEDPHDFSPTRSQRDGGSMSATTSGSRIAG